MLNLQKMVDDDDFSCSLDMTSTVYIDCEVEQLDMTYKSHRCHLIHHTYINQGNFFWLWKILLYHISKFKHANEQQEEKKRLGKFKDSNHFEIRKNFHFYSYDEEEEKINPRLCLIKNILYRCQTLIHQRPTSLVHLH